MESRFTIHDSRILGWDIGGVNVKVARVYAGEVIDVRCLAFELQRDPDRLVTTLSELARQVGGDTAAHAVTMTAELSQMFRTKREGVGFVLAAVERAFPDAAIRVYTVDGTFISCDDARAQPLAVAAANWVATATLVARTYPNALLIDIGTTTTDVVPIEGGRVVAVGRTDPERLASGELVYSGAVRTPVEAIVSSVPFGNAACGVSAEGFAIAGDVHVWRGDLASDDYCAPTPDGRPSTREFAGERLARMICADREIVESDGISAIADAVSAAQVARITDAIRRVISRHPSIQSAVVTGLGAFIAARAARDAGLTVIELANDLGVDAGRCAPATAVALLACATSQTNNVRRAGASAPAAQKGDLRSAGALAPAATVTGSLQPARYERVRIVKIGGSLLAHPDALSATLKSIDAAAADSSTVIVPGGGPFADAVRTVDAALRLTDDAAHWMAILAMDQHAHLLGSRLRRGRLVYDALEAQAALRTREVPVVAPATWLRACDPLPHSWEVTSDSIAAWIGAQLGAEHLVLVKAPGATGARVVDPYFDRAVPAGIVVDVVTADETRRLQELLRLPLSAASIRLDATTR